MSRHRASHRQGGRSRRWLTVTLGLTLLACGCSGVLETDDPNADCTGPKCDAWDEQNDPQNLALNLEYDLRDLPSNAYLTQNPWPGSAWRMKHDGIAWRWLGSSVLSPTEKYQQAFGASSQVTSWEINHHGTGLQEVGEWWGHCNGWASAALSEPEPQHAVEHNGVCFEVADIKALLVELHFSAKAVMVGGRCNAEWLDADQMGRPQQPECRDTNAGAFHVVLANLIGIHDRGFVIDFESTAPVFNHIAIGFHVDKLAEVTEEQATQLVTGKEGPYPHNDHADTFYDVATVLYYLPEDSIAPTTHPYLDQVNTVQKWARYEYLLEARKHEDGMIEVLGGEWLGDTRYEHPDFLWLPTSREGRGGEGSDYDNPWIDPDEVDSLVERSIAPLDGAPCSSGASG